MRTVSRAVWTTHCGPSPSSSLCFFVSLLCPVLSTLPPHLSTVPREYTNLPLCSIVRTVQVRHAPEPSDVIWENLEYGRVSRAFRMLLSCSFSLVIILIDIALITAVNG